MATAISVIASLLAVGFGAGIVLAGPLVDAVGYRGLFWLPVFVTGAAAIAAAAFIPDSPARARSRLPVLPALLLAAWLVALLLGLSQGNAWGWASGRVLALFALALVLAASWVAVELRAPVPMIDMQMMRRRGVWTSNVVALCVGFGMFGSFGFLPQLLQTPPEAGYGFGASITESGHLLLPSAVASFLVGFVTAGLVRRLGARTVIATGILVTGAAFTSIGLWHDQQWQVLLATTVQGVGSGLVFSSLASVVVTSVPPEQTGVASGMNNNIRTIGGSIGSAVMAGILTSQVGVGGLPAEHGYAVGFVMLGLVVAVSAFAALAMPDSHRQRSSGHLEDALDAELALVPGADPLPARTA
jgi:MFS family permease